MTHLAIFGRKTACRPVFLAMTQGHSAQIHQSAYFHISLNRTAYFHRIILKRILSSRLGPSRKFIGLL